jgi:hypothetical protein
MSGGETGFMNVTLFIMPDEVNTFFISQHFCRYFLGSNRSTTSSS